MFLFGFNFYKNNWVNKFKTVDNSIIFEFKKGS